MNKRRPMSRKSGASAQDLHDRACAAQERHYLDPDTGMLVFTALAHRERGYCCGSACRHCPYDHAAVKPADRAG